MVISKNQIYPNLTNIKFLKLSLNLHSFPSLNLVSIFWPIPGVGYCTYSSCWFFILAIFRCNPSTSCECVWRSETGLFQSGRAQKTDFPNWLKWAKARTKLESAKRSGQTAGPCERTRHMEAINQLHCLHTFRQSRTSPQSAIGSPADESSILTHRKLSSSCVPHKESQCVATFSNQPVHTFRRNYAQNFRSNRKR